MTRALLSFARLTRFGTPAFTIVRRPMLVEGKQVEVGQAVPTCISRNKLRLRQLYEQRLIAPVAGEVKTHTPAPEVKAVKPAQVKPAKAATKPPVVATSTVIPSVSVPVSETPPSATTKPRGYTPSMSNRKRA